jgi:hypothetical protein
MTGRRSCAGGPGGDGGAVAGAGTDFHSNVDVSASSQQNEMWYYTQHERNAGVMRPVQQLEPRPPVEAFAAAGLHPWMLPIFFSTVLLFL